MIAIIDYGVGNVTAIANQLQRLAVEFEVVSSTNQMEGVRKIILPGVGAFDDTMRRLNGSGMRDMLDEKVLGEKVPCLGVCIGMQIMTERSEEGREPGLGWFPNSEVVRLQVHSEQDKPHLPHMGWNSVTTLQDHPILTELDFELGFYFLHSYRVACPDENQLLSANFGEEFPCAISNANIFGFQFHPEKSHINGLNLFRNFAAY